MIVFVEGRREGYTPEQCKETMTVGELITFLGDNFDEDAKLYLSNDRGYTYGSISRDSFYAEEDDEEIDE